MTVGNATKVKTGAVSETVTIPRVAYDFLMGAGPLEGVWFNDLHKGLPGWFWWRGVLASAAGWPEPPEAPEAPPKDAPEPPKDDEDEYGPDREETDDR